VLALFDRGSNSDTSAGGSDLSWQTQRVDGGTIFLGSGGSRTAEEAGKGLPQVTVAVEHYNRMVRVLDEGLPVSVEMNLDVTFHPETEARPNGFNIIGELPGTDLADEIVLIGAHFDSWHGATGATDNATGSAAMMEVLRIIKAVGLQPRRTIRVALWGAEEQGLIGSRVYAEKYLGTSDAPGPEHARHTAYFNIDNGTGKIRGIWMQSNPAVAPIFGAWIEPLKDLGVEILGPRSVTSTDHTSIDRTGVPGFQFVQERLEYNSRTHHSNMDFYDRVQVDDMKQMATVAAVFAYQAAMRDQKLPRK
jgi:carboxypeptidase Q